MMDPTRAEWDNDLSIAATLTLATARVAVSGTGAYLPTDAQMQQAEQTVLASYTRLIGEVRTQRGIHLAQATAPQRPQGTTAYRAEGTCRACGVPLGMPHTTDCWYIRGLVGSDVDAQRKEAPRA